MTRLRSALIVALPLSVISAAAMAAPVVIGDFVASGAVTSGASYNAYNYTNEPTFEGYSQVITSGGSPVQGNGQTYKFGDVIGDPNKYDAESLTIDRNNTAGTISFTLKTKFDGNGGALPNARSSDMFISTVNTASPDGWQYAIAIGSNSISGGLGSRGSIAAPGFYQLTSNLAAPAPSSSYKTSHQVWTNSGFGMGGLIQFCQDTPSDPGTCDATASNGFAIEPAVQVVDPTPGSSSDGVTRLSAYNVTVTRTAIGGGWYNLTALISVGAANASLLNIFNQFDILASSADCANDALWGQVQTESAPAPAALFLLGLGLLGLRTLRRRAA